MEFFGKVKNEDESERKNRIFFRSIEEIHNETGGLCMGKNTFSSPKNVQ